MPLFQISFDQKVAKSQLHSPFEALACANPKQFGRPKVTYANATKTEINPAIPLFLIFSGSLVDFISDFLMKNAWPRDIRARNQNMGNGKSDHNVILVPVS